MKTAAAALERFVDLLRDPASGFQAQLNRIATRDGVSLKALAPRSLFVMNAPPELVDQSRDADYPELFVFAEALENTQREKGASFSGTARLGADVRISSEIPDQLEADLHRHVEAVLNVLDAAGAEWGPGIAYGGRYSVACAPARLGGNNFLQTARISFDLDLFFP
jgi:hypothetical protein